MMQVYATKRYYSVKAAEEAKAKASEEAAKA
jgi:hypothetical protein